jgi:Flp pilus assembly protein TadG
MLLFERLRPHSFRIQRWRDRLRRGVTAIEFALIAPAFFLIFIGMMEISLLMLAQHLLENSTFNASRLAKTGYIAEGKTQIDTVVDVLNTELGSLSPLIDVSKLTLTSTSFGELSDIGQTEGSDGLGAAEQIVVFTITYPWQTFTPMLGDLIGDENGIVPLTSRIVVRNEPYS